MSSDAPSAGESADGEAVLYFKMLKDHLCDCYPVSNNADIDAEQAPLFSDHPEGVTVMMPLPILDRVKVITYQAALAGHPIFSIRDDETGMLPEEFAREQGRRHKFFLHAYRAIAEFLAKTRASYEAHMEQPGARESDAIWLIAETLGKELGAGTAGIEEAGKPTLLQRWVGTRQINRAGQTTGDDEIGRTP